MLKTTIYMLLEKLIKKLLKNKINGRRITVGVLR